MYAHPFMGLSLSSRPRWIAGYMSTGVVIIIKERRDSRGRPLQEKIWWLYPNGVYSYMERRPSTPPVVRAQLSPMEGYVCVCKIFTPRDGCPANRSSRRSQNIFYAGPLFYMINSGQQVAFIRVRIAPILDRRKKWKEKSVWMMKSRFVFVGLREKKIFLIFKEEKFDSFFLSLFLYLKNIVKVFRVRSYLLPKY